MVEEKRDEVSERSIAIGSMDKSVVKVRDVINAQSDVAIDNDENSVVIVDNHTDDQGEAISKMLKEKIASLPEGADTAANIISMFGNQSEHDSHVDSVLNDIAKQKSPRRHKRAGNKVGHLEKKVAKARAKKKAAKKNKRR